MRTRTLLAAAAIVPLAIVAPQFAGAQGQGAQVSAHDYYFQAPDGSRTPASVSIAAGDSVGFGYAAGISQHDVHFTGGPAAPTCAGTNAASQAAFDTPGHSATPQGPGWSGSCSFATPGDYSFQCTLHPSLMYGVVHVAASQPSPPAPGGGPPPTATPALSDVSLAAVQHGSTVAGAVTLGSDGSRLTVALYAAHSLLASAHSALVGQSSSGPLSAGRHSFRVALSAAARRALRRRGRLALKVKLLVSAASQAPAQATRRMTLKA